MRTTRGQRRWCWRRRTGTALVVHLDLGPLVQGQIIRPISRPTQPNPSILGDSQNKAAARQIDATHCAVCGRFHSHERLLSVEVSRCKRTVAFVDGFDAELPFNIVNLVLNVWERSGGNTVAEQTDGFINIVIDHVCDGAAGCAGATMHTNREDCRKGDGDREDAHFESLDLVEVIARWHEERQMVRDLWRTQCPLCRLMSGTGRVLWNYLCLWHVEATRVFSYVTQRNHVSRWRCASIKATCTVFLFVYK